MANKPNLKKWILPNYGHYTTGINVGIHFSRSNRMRIYLRIISTFCVLLFGLYGYGQSYMGVTGKKDTSFTTLSAFKSAIKYYPKIKIVNQFQGWNVKEHYGMLYKRYGSRKMRIDAFYDENRTKVKKTAIVIIYGGGWRSGDRSQQYPLAQKLANLGYVCFTPDYSLSTTALFPAAIYDLKAAIRWVRKNADRFRIDTGRIAILGFSAGGEIAAFMGTTGNMPLFEGKDAKATTSSAVNAVIDIDGTLSFVHPQSGEGDDSKKISAATYWFGYSKKENPVLWESASPLSYVSAKTPPTLFLNSSVERMHAGRDDYIQKLNQWLNLILRCQSYRFRKFRL